MVFEIKREEVFSLKNKESSKSFDYKKLTIKLHSEVYEPAEDTFQLLEAIHVNETDSVFEIGTGCGLIALECCHRGADIVCSDINPFAVELTHLNYVNNKSCLKGGFEIRTGDLFSVLKPFEQFDVIIFNPPYLPTNSNDLVGDSGWFDTATDGGVDGLRVTRRFIDGLKKYLCRNGRAYFVFSSLAERKKLETYLSDTGFKSEIVMSRRFNDELIDIYCIYF